MSTVQTEKEFIPSKFQQAIYDFVQHGKGNAVVNAVAGSGKTSTTLRAIRLIPEHLEVAYFAFNRDIVEETQEKISLPNLTVKTLHGYGCSQVLQHIKGMTKDPDQWKYKRMLDAIYDYLQTGNDEGIATYEWKGAAKRDLWNFQIDTSDTEFDFSSYKNRVLRLCDLGRITLCPNALALEELAEKHDIELINGEAERAMQLISLGRMYLRTMDFADMIYLPVFHKLPVKQFDFTFVDECQDLNNCQRELMLMSVNATGRFMAVGDPFQAIYGFAGADVHSFNTLKSLPHTVELPLSYCYRCGADIIATVKNLVPHIEAAPSAKAGEVREVSKTEINDGDMVLCRNTFPLVKMCFDFLKRGIKASVKGSDIGRSLILMVKNSKATTMAELFERLHHELELVKAKIMRKQRLTEDDAMETQAYQNYAEKIEVIELLAQGTVAIDDVIARLEGIFKDRQKTGIILSTIHKSKGLEADRVFIIHSELMPSKMAKTAEAKEQENNLIYVAKTRAKHLLGFVTDFNAYNRDEANGSDDQPVKLPTASKHCGTVGQKHRCELTIIEVKEMNTNYGESVLTTMEDQDGNLFTKWGEIPSKFITSDHDEPVVGAKVAFMGTVKAHQTYNNTKTTVINFLSKI